MSQAFLYGLSGGSGKAENLDEVLNEQEALVETLRQTLNNKIASAGAKIEPIVITENGIYESTETVQGFAPIEVNVPDKIPDGYIKPEGTFDITKNGEHDVAQYEKVNVNVAASGGAPSIDGIPDGYARCDYIQFSGNQLVDTGIIGNQNTQINAVFTWEGTAQRHLFGCADSENTKSITSYMNGSWRFGNKYQSKTLNSKNPKLPYSALVNKSTISLNSSVTSISGVNDFETIGTLLLGGARDGDGTLPGVGITGKVFCFTLWQGEEQVFKLVPVVSAEGVYRFWDTVSQTFHDSITDTPLGGGNI